MRMLLRRRHRRILWVGLALFCLLFQQMAMATYVCTLPETQPALAGTGACADMAADQSHGSAQTHGDPRCLQHCTPHQTVQAAAHAPGVPPLVLPNHAPPSLAASLPAAERVSLPDPLQRRPEPSPTLRYCSLLI